MYLFIHDWEPGRGSPLKSEKKSTLLMGLGGILRQTNVHSTCLETSVCIMT